MAANDTVNKMEINRNAVESTHTGQTGYVILENLGLPNRVAWPDKTRRRRPQLEQLQSGMLTRVLARTFVVGDG